MVLIVTVLKIHKVTANDKIESSNLKLPKSGIQSHQAFSFLLTVCKIFVLLMLNIKNIMLLSDLLKKPLIVS